MKISFKLIFGLVIGVAGLFLAFSVGKMMWVILFPDPLSLTENSMHLMDDVIENLQDGQNTTVLFYLDDGFYLVGFDEGTAAGPVYLRPSDCFETSCLLICPNSGNERSCLNPKFKINQNSVHDFIFENPGGVVLSESGKYITLYLETQGNNLLIEQINS
jgi:hypothetical protein